MTASATSSQAPTVRNPEDGERLNVLGDRQRFVLTGAETGGAFCLIEQTNESGVAIPQHYHTREIETFHVIEGSVQYTVEDRVVIAGPGTTVTIPRGVRHSFEVLEKCRVLLTLVPAGIENMFRELAQLTPGPDVMPKAMAVCERYGIFFVL